MIKAIQSKDNSKLKQWQKLKTKKGRNQTGSFIVDGLRIVNHAIEHGQVLAVIVVDTFEDTIDFDGEIYSLPMGLFKTIVETDHPQGVAAIVKIKEQPLKEGPILFLDQVQDPGNLGTLIRTADAAGFTGVMLRKGCTDPYGQKALRSSMGSMMSIPVIMNQTIEELLSLNYPIYGAALENGVSYKSIDYKSPCVLVIGNEANGITHEVLDIVTQRVYIPMAGDVESLNASIAGGVLMFEIASNIK